jgi:hypothetical protein
LARVAYRTRHVLHAFLPGLDDSHLETARSVLGDGEFSLFLSMEKRDQRHGLRVMEHLRGRHHADRDLLAAALLHDCGKGSAPVWLRIAHVAATPVVRRLASNSGSATGLAAYRLVHHAELGAELAGRAGASEATVRYISGRVAEHEHDKIALLRAADDKS